MYVYGYLAIYFSTNYCSLHTSHKLSNTIITFIYIRNKNVYIHKKLARDFFQKQYFQRIFGTFPTWRAIPADVSS